MTVNGVEIVDTYAEAFPMAATRLIVSAATPEWAWNAGLAATGYAASVIGCDCEAGIEKVLESGPDGRPAVSLLFFAFSRANLEIAVVNRVANCILTCATTAVFSGLAGDAGREIQVGGKIRYFGDGWQISKRLGDSRYWRVPTMDGEFLCEDSTGTVKGVAGGNFLIVGETAAAALAAAEEAVTVIRRVCADVILPFPGGIVRSGSKVGSKYQSLRASTNDAYCPTLRGVVPSELPQGANCVYEIVIDGLTLEAVKAAMSAGIRAACQSGVLRISGGNYGGQLGPHLIHLRQLSLS